ncbi:MAG: sugar ABC transporter ATP-binding protein [Bacillota bacterium]
MSNTVLKMVGISKYFPGVKALEQVHIEVAEGEILALLGENGAGKSTLMKVLAGVYQPDTGEIYINGNSTKINGPRSAQSLGISIIYQEFNLIPYLSVAENIFLGREPRLVKGVLNLKQLYKDTEELLRRVGLERISPKTIVEELSIAEQQLVEIAKALSCEANIIIMDEPTAALNEEDTDRLLRIMKGLKEQGTAIIFITHRLEEVEKVADRITVLRDGQYIGSENTKNISKDDMVRMMVGRDIKDLYPSRNNKIGQPVLKVSNLSVKNKLQNINFTLHEGEILGIGGLMGSGSEILSKVLFGMYHCSGGTIEARSQNIATIRDAIDAGIALVTDDRKSEGLVLSMSVYENLLLLYLSTENPAT